MTTRTDEETLAEMNRRLREYNEPPVLKENPPCFACGMRRSEHAGEKCLFVSTWFTMPTDDQLIYYAITQTFKKDTP